MLRPQRCSLSARDRQAHARLYCGLCQGLGVRHGLAARALLSHDAVLVAALVDGLQEGPGEPSSTRCPLLPIIHRPTVGPGSTAIRFAVDVQTLLADQWLADRSADGRVWARWARGALESQAGDAARRLSGMGVPVADIIEVDKKQSAAERRAGSGQVVDFAKPTMHALGVLFASMARLEGVPAGARAGETAVALEQCGRSLGAVIYLVDVLEDLGKDLWSGEFNPCVEATGRWRRVVPGRVHATARALREHLSLLRGSVRRLPLRRHRGLVESVVMGTLPARAQEAQRYALRVMERTQVRAARWLPRLVVAAALLWVWFADVGRAWADGRRRARHAHRPDAGHVDAGSPDASRRHAGQGLVLLPPHHHGGAAAPPASGHGGGGSGGSPPGPDPLPPAPEGSDEPPLIPVPEDGTADKAAETSCSCDACCQRPCQACQHTAGGFMDQVVTCLTGCCCDAPKRCVDGACCCTECQGGCGCCRDCQGCGRGGGCDCCRGCGGGGCGRC